MSPGTQILSLVQQRSLGAGQLSRDATAAIRQGNPAEIRVDAFPGLVLKGKVAEIAPASGSQFALLPPDNATGNFTKVTQRVPVKIVARPKPVRIGPAAAGALRDRGGSDQRPILDDPARSLRPPPKPGAAPITTHPYIGILGVFLGAATATLNGTPAERRLAGFARHARLRIRRGLLDSYRAQHGHDVHRSVRGLSGSGLWSPARVDDYRSACLPWRRSCCRSHQAWRRCWLLRGDRGTIVGSVLYADADVRRSQSAAQAAPLRRRGLCVGHRCQPANVAASDPRLVHGPSFLALDFLDRRRADADS